MSKTMSAPFPPPLRTNPSSPATSFAEDFDYVYRTFRRRGFPSAEAEDLTQDVFVVVCRRWGDVHPDRPIRPWVAGIAYRVALDNARRRSRREVPTPEVEEFALDTETLGPEDQLCSARARRLTLRALAMLPERHRSVLVRYHLDGASIREIAEESSTPFFTVAGQIRRARARFTKAMRQLQLRMSAPRPATCRR